MVLEALGFASPDGRSENKLKIEFETKLDVFQDLGLPGKAFFNPKEISIEKTVVWASNPKPGTDADDPQFAHGNSRILAMELIFDTYEAGEPVTNYTQLIAGLTTVKDFGGDLHRPPLCRLSWGSAWGLTSDGVFFVGVLENLQQRFTLFLSDGTPVRATLNCRFKEWISALQNSKAQGKTSADVAKIRTVRRGDTLSSIANEEYNDSALWRHIAESNAIDNPRLISPGQNLVIPAIRSGSKSRSKQQP